MLHTASPNPVPRCPKEVSEGSETHRFFLKRFGNSYGGSKLDEIGPEELFCYIWLLQGHPKASSDGFRGVSEGSETLPFFKRRFRNGFMIHLESYGGSKLDEISPDDLFCYIRLLQGHPEASSDGFRGVSEGSETVWFQRGFRGV